MTVSIEYDFGLAGQTVRVDIYAKTGGDVAPVETVNLTNYVTKTGTYQGNCTTNNGVYALWIYINNQFWEVKYSNLPASGLAVLEDSETICNGISASTGPIDPIH